MNNTLSMRWIGVGAIALALPLAAAAQQAFTRGAVTIISFAFLLWSALGIFSALSNGISRAFENAPKRPFWQDKLIGLLLMAVTGLLGVASVVIGIVTGIIQSATADFHRR